MKQKTRTQETLRQLTKCVLALSLLAFPLATHAEVVSEADFKAAFKHYEQIRNQLLNDSIAGVDEAATALQKVALETKTRIGGAHADHTEEVHRLIMILDEISEGAHAMNQAGNLEEARDGFYAVSKPLVRFRNRINGETGVVAYCPMVKRSWIQPEGEIGNPYKGQVMQTCGEVVED